MGRQLALLRVILLILLIGWLAPALSQPAEPASVHLTASTRQLDLAGRMSYLIDPTGKLTLDQVMAQRVAGAFVLGRSHQITAGHRPRGAVWVHLRLERAADAPTNWWLEAGDDILDEIQLFEIAPDGTLTTRLGGRALPFAERELAWHKHAFWLTLEDRAPREVYLRYASRSTLRILPRLFEPRAYDQHRASEDLFLGAYFGIMSLAFLISGFRAIRYRSPVDGFYALYILGLDSTQFVNLGLWQQLGLSESLALRQFLVGAGMVVAAIALTGFVRHLIDWPAARAKGLDRPLIVIRFVYVASYVLVWMVAPATILAFVNAVSTLFVLGILGAALWATYRGYGNARFFLIAFTPFLVAALGRLGEALGLFLGGEAVYYLHLLASIIHATLLMTAILIRDATQRRTSEQLEWQLMRLREDLANRALFTRMLAHEVRTPLAIIDSYSQMLGSHAADHGTSGTTAGIGAGIMTQAEQIRAAVRRLAAILDRFLRQDRFTTLARVEWVSFDLDRLIADTVAEVQRQSEDHLLSYCSAAKDLRISGDPDLLRILLLNLLENAVHYSPEGGSIQVRAAAEDAGVTIAVSDEGVGIPAEAREQIFDRYYRTSQVKDAIGAGLGLYIVRSIARLHGGDVWCDSTLGEGSTFQVSLRRTRAG